jgi:uncharacterized protein (TIGR03067 family)
MTADPLINGKWRLTRSVAAGVEGASPEGTFLVIKDNLFERHTPEYVFERQIDVNKDTSPAKIDLHITNEPDKGKIFLGIYKLEGDTLFIAHSLPGNPRPTQFESTAENKQILSVSVRER